MSCVEVQAELFPYQFGEIAPEARASVEAHLLTCATCLREFVALKREVETGASEAPPSAAVRQRLRYSMAVELGLRQSTRPRWWERPLALTFAAASLTTALLLLHQVTTSSGTMPHALANSPAGMRFSTGQH